MIRRNGDLLLEDDVTRAARERRASLYRAALALAVMSVLLAWLLLDEDQVAPAGEASAPMPSLAAPVVPAMPAMPALPAMPEMAVTLPPSGEQAPARPEDAVAVAARDSRTEDSSPPPLQQALALSDSATPAEPANSGDVQAAPSVTATEPALGKQPARVVVEPEGGVPGSAPAAAATDGYRIQLGQFVDMSPAAALHDTLLRHGYPVRLQVRVAAGPYAQRKAAESALASLRGKHGLGGLIVAPPSGKGYIVQLGVFAERGNADELAERLKTWGHATQLHARVVVGPYPDQKSAQAALQRLKRERGSEGVVIVPST